MSQVIVPLDRDSEHGRDVAAELTAVLARVELELELAEKREKRGKRQRVRPLERAA